MSIGTRHPRHVEIDMLDWLKQAEATDALTPSYKQIVDRFGFDGAEQARTLVAQLADAGRIRLSKSSAATFDFTIAPPGNPEIATSPVYLLGRPTSAVPVTAPERQAPDTPAAQPVGARQPQAQPTRVVARQPARPFRPTERTRQVSFMLDADVFKLLDAEAVALDLATGPHCRDVLVAAARVRASGASDTASTGPLAKPRIPAPVMAAFLADGRGFDHFCADLLALGLEQYRDFRNAGDRHA